MKQEPIRLLADILDCSVPEAELLCNGSADLRSAATLLRLTGQQVTFGSLLYTVWEQALENYSLKPSVDSVIYINGAEDTHIYVQEDLDPAIKEKLETIFGFDLEVIDHV